MTLNQRSKDDMIFTLKKFNIIFYIAWGDDNDERKIGKYWFHLDYRLGRGLLYRPVDSNSSWINKLSGYSGCDFSGVYLVVIRDRVYFFNGFLFVNPEFSKA
jgi:hypothetical protein